MANLLTNPLLNTGEVTITPASHVMGDWYSNHAYYGYDVKQFEKGKYSFNSVYTGAYTHYINRSTSTKYLYNIKQDFVITDYTAYSTVLFSLKALFKIKRLDGIYWDVYFNDGSTDYYYNDSTGWQATSTPQYNDFGAYSFNDSSVKVNTLNFIEEISQFPDNGTGHIIISCPYVVSTENINTLSFLYFGRWDGSITTPTNTIYYMNAMALEYVSLTPTNATNLPEITSIVTTNDNGTTNGTATISGEGGTTPYTYSIDNLTYQSTGVFDNLSSGSYTGYLKDATGLIDSKQFTIDSDLTYNKSVYGQLSNIDGDVYKYEIHEANFSGTARERTLAVDGLNFTYPQGYDFFDKPIRSSSCDITIITESGDNFDTLVSGSNRNAYVKVFKNGDVFWMGWILPAFFVEDYASAPYHLTFSARDGVTEFSENTFDSLAEFNIDTKGEVRISDFMCKLFDSITDGKINFTASLYSIDSDDIELNWYRHWINIDQYIEDEKDLSDLITNLLTSLGMYCTQMGGDWYFTRLSDFSTSTLTFKSYDTKGVYIETITINRDLFLNTSTQIIGTPTIQLQEPFKKIVVKEDYLKKEAGNNNSQFDNWDNIGIGVWQLKNWKGISSGEVFTGDEPKEVTLPIDTAGTGDYLTQFIQDVEAGGKIKFSTKVKLLGDLDTGIPGGTPGSEYDAVELEMQILLYDSSSSDVYYFDASDTSWDLSGGDKIILKNFSSDSGSEEGYKISEEMPVSGVIEIRIYRHQYISFEVDYLMIEFLDNSGNPYTDININYQTINPKNRYVPDDFELMFSNVPNGYNNRNMYRGYISNGSTTDLTWYDSSEQLIGSIVDLFIGNIARKKAYPYRKISGIFKSSDITPLKNIFVYSHNLSEDVSERVDLYRGYIFAGGTFNCYSNQWSCDWLEINQAQKTTDLSTEEETTETVAKLLIDDSHYLLIDETHKLLI